LLGLLSGLWFTALSGGDGFGISDANEAALRQEVAVLVRQLDSDQFEARRQAASKLQQLKARPEATAVLAEEFQRILLSPDTSFEVRRQVERLRSGLPPAPSRRQATVAVEEIGRLVGQLEDDRYGIRLGATRRLEWLLENPKLACTIYSRLKQRLDKADVSLDARRWIEPMCVEARGTWLTSDPAAWDLPPVADSQIQGWLDDLVRPPPDLSAGGQSRLREKAMRDLRDLLARDEYETKVKQAVEARLGRRDLDSRVVPRLRELIELTRPAMVAEFWQGRRQRNTQHLVIGVPSWGANADRASHFDYIDDDVAFCANGQNLSPGNYPVGVAIPHPKSPGAMIHLVNLSTPRQKMAYACLTQDDEGKRLADLSRRTLQRFLAARQRLSLEELLLLEQLDPAEVSRFAGRYFLAVEDRAIPEEVVDASLGRPPLPGADPSPGRPLNAGQASRHGILCWILATDGTQAAVPDLLTAIERGRFLPPTPKTPYRLPWIAALAIASRDPWPGADRWLAQAVARTDLLIVGHDKGPELGATAAGVLLARHREEPVPFGLNEVEDARLDNADLTGYRFETPGSRKRVLQWWSEHQAKQSP
jgi:hypothetical protein